MKPTRVDRLPDLLLRYPIGSMLIWRRLRGYDKRARVNLYDYVPARVTGKTAKQGNKRLAFDALYIGSNITGVNVLYIKRFHAVDVANVMSVSTYLAMRHATRGVMK